MRRFAQLLGGDLKVKSTPGIRSRFTLRIEAGEMDDIVCVPPAEFRLEDTHTKNRQFSKARLDGVNVHMVEDTAAIALLIRHLLEEVKELLPRIPKDRGQQLAALLQQLG